MKPSTLCAAKNGDTSSRLFWTRNRAFDNGTVLSRAFKIAGARNHEFGRRTWELAIYYDDVLLWHCIQK